VIGNGDRMRDGEVQYGYRWSKQMNGTSGDGAISICLIGDFDREIPTVQQMEKLTWLVRELQQRFAIAPNRVYLKRDLANTTDPGLFFPATRFRQQLLDPIALGG
jgi:N-acetyl-anhydromuramyl-L-alanine amidase AmpD